MSSRRGFGNARSAFFRKVSSRLRKFWDHSSWNKQKQIEIIQFSPLHSVKILQHADH